MKKNIIQKKTFDFALQIVKLSQKLQDKKEYVLSNQLLKSGTSIGANVREAQSAESNKDFVHKLSIALKESKESDFWLHLLKESNIIESLEADLLIQKNIEIARILSKIILTSKRKLSYETDK